MKKASLTASLVISISLFLVASLQASDKKKDEGRKTSPEFQKLLSLAGNWSGTGMME